MEGFGGLQTKYLA